MIFEALQQEMYSAMKSGDRFRKEVISGLIADIKRVAIDKNCRDNITEEVVNTVLLKSRKMAQEMIDTCPESRPDLLEQYQRNAAIMDEYVPKLITDTNEIAAIISQLLVKFNVEPTKSNMGKIMKLCKENLNGKVDMKIVSNVVKSILV